MIDHVSLPVRSLEASARFYEAVLGAIGFARLVDRADTVGFGKRHAEVWINRRPQMQAVDADSGAHVCLRARSKDEVDAFYRAALGAGGSDDGAPGPRPHDVAGQVYYAAFVRDPDGNRVEAVCFVEEAKQQQ
jgi:catechol 2,3-dioxygenase-like lactoylglutathione lyase family enzyme